VTVGGGQGSTGKMTVTWGTERLLGESEKIENMAIELFFWTIKWVVKPNASNGICGLGSTTKKERPRKDGLRLTKRDAVRAEKTQLARSSTTKRREKKKGEEKHSIFVADQTGEKGGTMDK